jgi:hypothetical protein
VDGCERQQCNKYRCFRHFLSLYVRSRSATYAPYVCRTFWKGNAMARQVRNSKLDSRTARARLPSRREPFWTVISAGCALGYRQGAKGGTWIGKYRDDQGRRHYQAFGAADDFRDADGLSVFSFAQAQEQARTFFARKVREAAGDLAPHEGPYTVADALRDYLTAYDRRGGKAIYDTRRAVETHILPALGEITVSRLTARKIEDWHHGLAEQPARVRTKPGKSQRHRKHDAGPEAVRQRRSTANRILTVLKAALNHAWNAGHVSSDDAWRRVKPFKAVEAAGSIPWRHCARQAAEPRSCPPVHPWVQCPPTRRGLL